MNRDREPDAEAALVAAFVVPSKRDRIQELLSKPKRRRSVLESLYHQAPLDARFMSKIPPKDQSASGIEALLRAKGAPDLSYVISTDRDLDGKTMALREVLDRIVGGGSGTILSCVPGRLGYYEAEDPGERYLLMREGGPTTGCS